MLHDVETDKMLSRVKKLIKNTSVPNWGGKDEKPIPKDLWKIGLGIHKVIEKNTGVKSFISPDQEGSVNLKWLFGENNRNKIVLNIHPELNPEISCRSKNRKYSQLNFPNLQEAIDFVKTEIKNARKD